MTPAYDPSRILVSLHIPKTAGTSFRRVLQGWFGEGFHTHYPAWPDPIVIAPDAPGVCVHGHFNRDVGLGLADSYPGAEQFITVLRDPFERMVSLWRFLNREQAGGRTRALDGVEDFDRWFGGLRDQAARAPAMTGFLRNYMPDLGTADPFARFVAVGLTERMQDSVDLFARVLDKPPAIIPHVNAAQAGDLGAWAAWRPLHEQAFPLEHEVYARGRARFAAAARVKD